MSGGVRKGLAAVAAACAALIWLPGHAAAGPAGSGNTADTAAAATWQPEGEAVKGAATTADAPALTPGRSYQDTLKVGDKKYYGVDLDAKSSAYLSAFALPKPGSRVAYNDGIDLKLQSADGDECDSYEAHFGTDGATRPVGGYTARTIAKSGSRCQTANRYTLEVTRVSAGTSDPGDWPVEIRFLSEPGLKGGGGTQPEPAATATEATPAPVTGTPRRAHGGTSPATAAAVKGGVWNDQVLPGETRFYKLPVDWGQRAVVFTDFANAQTVKDSQFVSGGVRVETYDPARGYIDGDSRMYEGQQTSITSQTVPVSYANRFESGVKVSPVRFAGWYYVAVSVHPDVAKVTGAPIGITLRVDIKGAAKAAPPYDGDAPKAGFGITGDDLDAADGTATGGSESTLRVVAFAAFGAGTVLVLSLLVWVIAARLRPRAAAGTVDTGGAVGGVPQRQAPGYGPPS